MKEPWRSCTLGPGEVFVTTTGATVLLKWSAECWVSMEPPELGHGTAYIKVSFSILCKRGGAGVRVWGGAEGKVCVNYLLHCEL